MKTRIFILAFLVAQLANDLSAQIQRCGTTEVTNAFFAASPGARHYFDSCQAVLNVCQNSLNDQHRTTYTIPVVFHVLHQGGTENISDAQILDGLEQVNIDFAKQNDDTVNTIAEFKAIAKGTDLRFVLARKDPDGNCTPGIIHYTTAATNWEIMGATYAQTWDPTKYLNIYVVKRITLQGLPLEGGYTSLPGTYPSGNNKDAVVIDHNFVGTIETSIPTNRHILTHEVGHWFNLMHVFGTNMPGQNCNGDDFVSDTPPTKGFNLYCPTTYDICNPGVQENFQNFMDYSYCSTMFTQGQVARMHATTTSSISGRNNLWLASNLTATGINPPAACAPIANFKSDKQLICKGQGIQFTDQTFVSDPTSWDWQFTGGTPASSTSQHPVVVYNTPGTYPVQLTSGNSTGNDTETKTAYITVLPDAIATGLTEGFEGLPVPNSTWTAKSTAIASDYKWEQTNLGAATGSKSLYVNENTMGNWTLELYSPLYNLNAMSDPGLSFKWAGAEREQASYSYDIFSIEISTDCGESWNSIFNKGILSTTPGVSGVVNGNFIPTSSQFHQEFIPLTSFAGSASALFRLKFVSEATSSNNFYIDDINLSAVSGIQGQALPGNLHIFPNPAEKDLFLDFDLKHSQVVNVSLKDIHGKHIQSTLQYLPEGNHTITLPVSHLPQGIYFTELILDGIRCLEKIVIQ